jgi:hypothetical protein
MDWRFGAAGFVVALGLVAGWLHFGTLVAAVLSALFLVGLFGVSLAIDAYIYDL